jgi:hypothetical protein
MNDRGFEAKPFHPLRRTTVGVLEAASRKHMIHALLEVDVSEPRINLRQMQIGDQTGWGYRETLDLVPRR